jgi:hypothetical protein
MTYSDYAHSTFTWYKICRASEQIAETTPVALSSFAVYNRDKELKVRSKYTNTLVLDEE